MKIIKALQSKQEENPLPEADLVACIWQGLMQSVDWSARPDQLEALALREVTVSFDQTPLWCTSHSVAQKYAAVLEPFCNGPKTEVSLINAVQVYCYEDTRVIKTFPQILKVGKQVSSLIINLKRNSSRSCTTRTVYPIRPLCIGTRKVPSPKAVSISLLLRRRLSRYNYSRPQVFASSAFAHGLDPP